MKAKLTLSTGKVKQQRAPSPELTPSAVEIEEDLQQSEKPIPSPMAIFQNLISSGVIPNPLDLAFLKVCT